MRAALRIRPLLALALLSVFGPTACPSAPSDRPSVSSSSQALSTESHVWQDLTAPWPPELKMGAAAYDADRSKVVMFGGYRGAEVVRETWEWDGIQWQLASNEGPDPRSRPALAYDPVRKRMVLFGGATAQNYLFGDTWEWDGATWHLAAQTGPSARRDARITYDPSSNTMLLYGGTDGSANPPDDTWQWDGSAWSRVATAGPGGRIGPALAYDPAGDQVVLFGGATGLDELGTDETWIWKGSSWGQAQVAGPPASYRAVMVSDPARGLVAVGAESGQAMGTWLWSNNTWAQIDSSPIGSGEYAPATLLYNDSAQAVQLYYESIWTLGSAAWVAQPRPGPSARAYHGQAFDAARGKTLLFGGYNGSERMSDTWTWDGIQWSQAAVVGPSPRSGFGMAYDSKRSQALVFGGSDDTWQALSETYAWDGSGWSQLSAGGPPGRWNTNMVYDQARDRVVLFGGNDASFAPFADTWEWDSSTWTQVASTGPAPRRSHVMAYDLARGRVVLFGGEGSSGPIGDTWEWDGTTWEQKASIGPTGQSSAIMAYDSARKRTVLFGGGTYPLSDETWEWDGATWKKLTVTGPRSRRAGAMSFDSQRGRLVLFGGDPFRLDTWEYHSRGGSCAVAADCDTGHCTDGVCCETPCDGACEACNGAERGWPEAQDGVCSVAVDGFEGRPACVSNLCDGTSHDCPGDCVTDADCTPTHYCGADSTCKPQSSLGAACDLDIDCSQPGCRACASGHCVDGVCCEQACAAVCVACSASKKGSGNDGECAPVASDSDPDDDCSQDPGYPVSCLADGMCDGNGACRSFAKAGDACGTGTCNNTDLTAPACDGLGSCGGPVTTSCAPYACESGACATSCGSNDDCAPVAFCSDDTCIERYSNGHACTDGHQCSSGICADGVCCSQPCEGPCEACNVAGSEGACSPVVGEPALGHPACPAGTDEYPCQQASCDGVTRDRCAAYVGSSVVCRAASCKDGLASVEQRCDGAGDCPADVQVSCEGYACNGDGCGTSPCAEPTDCVSGYRCDTLSGTCVTGSLCVGEALLSRADGTTQECNPYRCEGDRCKEACTGSKDCAPGFVCDVSTLPGVCIAPSQSESEQEGCGCSAIGSGRAKAPWMAMLAVLGLLLATRSKRARAAFPAALSTLLCACGSDTPPPGEPSGSTASSIESPVWEQAFHGTAAPRWDLGAAYDEQRDRMVVFGGVGPGWATDTWLWDGAQWFVWRGAGPAPRRGPAMAYDSDRGVVVLFGGLDEQDENLGDTWEWNGQTWTLRLATGPLARTYAAMVYDPVRKRMVLYGGETDPLFQQLDTWEWDGTTWEKRSQTGPSAATGMAMAYEPMSQKVIAFGGEINDGQTASGDTWAWDGTAWSQLASTGPAARSFAKMAWDSARSRMVLYGGEAKIGFDYSSFGDTWEWNGSAWNQAAVSVPSPRSRFSLVYHTKKQAVALWAGHSTFGEPSLDELWLWNGSAWTQQPSAAPPRINGHATAFDAVRGSLFMFGGLQDGKYFEQDVSDAWWWDGTSWTPVNVPGPAARHGHSMASDTLRKVVVLVGGSSAADAWEWNGAAWSQIAAGPADCDSQFTRRSGAAMTYDSSRGLTILFGGKCEGLSTPVFKDDTWAWNGASWASLPTGPEGRADSCAAFDVNRAKLVLFGGMNSSQSFADTWELGQTGWDKASSSGPPARSACVMAYDPARKRVVLSGGTGISGVGLTDTWEWDGTNWTQQAAADGPPARSGAAGAYDLNRKRLVVVGGITGPTRHNDVWEYRQRGNVCTGPQDCNTGYCVDGVCCESICSGACEACDGETRGWAGARDGVCSVAPAGHPGDPSCQEYVCDGEKASCSTTCSTDAVCAAERYCAAGGICSVRKDQGSACDPSAGSDCSAAGCRVCSSNHCVDGFCCDSACDGPCEACSAAFKGQGTDGTCEPVQSDTDPRDRCPIDPGFPISCGADGLCDGAGVCRPSAKAGTSCAPMACSGALITQGACDGNGTCVSETQENCFPYGCDGVACESSCTSEGGCAEGAYCLSDSSCQGRKPLGDACDSAAECQSGFCVDGHCCSTACDGQCEACDVMGAEGACAAVTGEPHGQRPSCAEGSETCEARRCDGTERTMCAGFAPNTTPCREASCAEGVSTIRAFCDGNGACPSPEKVPCAPYVCQDDACGKAPCVDDQQCASQYECSAGECVALQGAVCADELTLREPGGGQQSCAPYTCRDGRCIETCSGSAECAPQHVCDTGKCVLANAPTQPGGEGCGCRVASSARTTAGVASSCLALLGLLVRRRRIRGVA